MRGRSLFLRFYTRRPLRDYAEAAARFVEALARPHVAGHRDGLLRANAFVGSEEREVTDEGLTDLLRELRGGRVESFALFRRDPRAPPDAVFPFFLRIDSEPAGAVYYKYRAHHEFGDPYPLAPGGYCLELGLGPDLLEGAGAVRPEDVLSRAQEVFLASESLYGYLGAGSSVAIFQRLSPLEADRQLFRSLKETPWIDQYDRRLAGVFWANLLGPTLARQVRTASIPGRDWHVEPLGGGLLIRGRKPFGEAGPAGNGGASEGDVSALAPALGHLLPSTSVPARPLPSPRKSAYLFDRGQAERLGGAAFLQAHLPAEEVLVVGKGDLLVARELRHEFDDYPLLQFLWPLRPAKCALWEVQLPDWSATDVKTVGPMDEPTRVHLRVRVTRADLQDPSGVPLRLVFAGRSPRALREKAVAALQSWAREGGTGRPEIEPDERGATGRIPLRRLDVAGVLEAVERVRPVAEQSRLALLLSLGPIDDRELRLRESMIKPGGVHVHL